MEIGKRKLSWYFCCFVCLRFTHFVDILSAEEQEEVMKEKKIRAEVNVYHFVK